MLITNLSFFFRREIHLEYTVNHKEKSAVDMKNHLSYRRPDQSFHDYTVFLMLDIYLMLGRQILYRLIVMERISELWHRIIIIRISSSSSKISVYW